MAIASKPEIIQAAIKEAADNSTFFKKKHDHEKAMLTEVILMISEDEVRAEGNSSQVITADVLTQEAATEDSTTPRSMTRTLRPTVLLEENHEPKVACTQKLNRRASLTLPKQAWKTGGMTASQLTMRLNQGAASLIGALNRVSSAGYAAISEEQAKQLLESPMLQQVAKLQLKPEHRSNIEAQKHAESRLRQSLQMILTPKPETNSLKAVIIIIARYGFVKAAKQALVNICRSTTRSSSRVARLFADLEQGLENHNTMTCQ